MRLHLYGNLWSKARTTDNWQTYSDSEDDLESIDSFTMMELPQPLSAYVPLTLESSEEESDDDISMFSGFSTANTTENTLESGRAKRKIAECLENQGRGQKLLKLEQDSSSVMPDIEEGEDYDDLVYLKTVPPPHMVIDLTMDED